VFPEGIVFTLSSKEERAGEVEIAVVEEEIVQPLVREAGRNASVTYEAAATEAILAVGTGAAAAVLVRPTPTQRVLAVADAGGVMPPKSTYFAPKVPSGLLILPFDDVPQGSPS
jgi:uncharacterized protein (DUF1015 family)